MRKLALIPICTIALIVPVAVLAAAAELGFNGVVHRLERQFHLKATRVPLMGLINLVARGASKGAVSGLQIAEFEDFSGDVNGDDLNHLVEQQLGPKWERVVRESSRNGASQTLIYMRPEGGLMGMFVLDADGHELDVVQLSVDAAHVAEQINHYDHHAKEHGHVEHENHEQESAE